jgi:hypothetical protein
MRRIGIDVGGTNTDARGDRRRVGCAAVKAATTADVTGGILAALQALSRDPEVDHRAIDAVMIGTTHFINAVVAAAATEPVAALRIGLPAARPCRPSATGPTIAADLVAAGRHLVEGGYEYDGRPFMPLDEAAIAAAARAHRRRGVGAVAVSSPPSRRSIPPPRAGGGDLRPHRPMPRRHPVARTRPHRPAGARERGDPQRGPAELARETTAAFEDALAGAASPRPSTSPRTTARSCWPGTPCAFPVYSFASGPTNSDARRGLPLRHRRRDGDRCRRHHRRCRPASPRLSARGEQRRRGRRRAHLFRMPDLLSIGLGGGSHVDPGDRRRRPAQRRLRLTRRGPRLRRHVLTATDVAVAAGLLDLGDRTRVADLDPASSEATIATRMHAMIAERSTA